MTSTTLHIKAGTKLKDLFEIWIFEKERDVDSFLLNKIGGNADFSVGAIFLNLS